MSTTTNRRRTTLRTGPLAMSASAAALLALTLSSCTLRSSERRGVTMSMTSVPVAYDADVAAALETPDRPLEEGEVLRRQTFSLRPDGEFSVTRTIEKDVGYFGLHTAAIPELPPETGSVPRSPRGGLLVRAVQRDSPAAAAGIMPGDIVVEIDGQLLRTTDQLDAVVQALVPGSRAKVSLVPRNGEELVVDVVVGRITRIVRSTTHRRQLETLADLDRTGLRLVEVPAELRPAVFGETPEATEGRGALLIAEMLPGGPAYFSELRLKDRLVAVDETAVGSFAEYGEALSQYRPGERVPMRARGLTGEYETRVRVASNARARRDVNFLGLVHSSRRAARSDFGLIWNLLCHWERSHDIEEDDGVYDHTTDTAWGFALNLLAYHGTPRRKTFRLAWFIPISFSTD